MFAYSNERVARRRVVHSKGLEPKIPRSFLPGFGNAAVNHSGDRKIPARVRLLVFSGLGAVVTGGVQ